MWFSTSFSCSSSTSSTASSPSSSSLPPPPPPPSPNDSLLDITPRKASFSSSQGRNTSCAFPSWPNRPSLLSETQTSASAYLSEEDLFPEGSDSCPSEAIVDDELALPAMGGPDMTTEEQVMMIRAAAEEDERRLRFLAHVHAHARAQQQQAMRMAHLTTAEQNATRKKKKAASDRKRRITSSSRTSSA